MVKVLTKANSSKQARRQQALALMKKKNQQKVVRRPGTNRRQRRKRVSPIASGGSSLAEAYRKCRLTPFRSLGSSVGIPDGAVGRRVVIDHRMITTLQFGSSGTIYLAIVPCLPSPLWVYNGDTVINGVAYPDNVGSYFYNPVCLGEWDQMALTYNATAGHFNLVANPFAATKFRIVTIGWSLHYMGTTLTDSGNVVINSGPMTFGDSQPNTVTFAVYSGASGTNTNISANQVFIRELNDTWLNTGTIASNSETVVLPLKANCHGVLRHASPNYPVFELSEYMTYVTQAIDNSVISVLMNKSATPATAGISGVVQGIDMGWDPLSINITGGTSGQSVMLDLLVCVEYYPGPSSSVYALAKPGPVESKGLIQSVENAARAMPLAEIGGALSTAASVASIFV